MSLRYGWWKKSCTTQHWWNPVNNGIFAISIGTGFLPSTVWNSFCNFQYSACDHCGMSMFCSDVDLIALPFQWFSCRPAPGHCGHIQLVIIRFISIWVLLSEFNYFHTKNLLFLRMLGPCLCVSGLFPASPDERNLRTEDRRTATSVGAGSHGVCQQWASWTSDVEKHGASQT